MRSYIALAVFGIVVMTSGLSAQQGALQTAADTLGVAKVKTLQVTGSGANFSVGQNYTSNDAWPRVEVKNYTASVNYDTGSMRVELLRDDGSRDAARAAARRSSASSAKFSSSAATSRGTCPRRRRMRPLAPRRRPPRRQMPQPERMLALWATPKGFVKARDGQQRDHEGERRQDRRVLHRRRQVQDGRHHQRTGTGREGPHVDRPVRSSATCSSRQRIRATRISADVSCRRTWSRRRMAIPSYDLTISAVTVNPAVDIDGSA